MRAIDMGFEMGNGSVVVGDIVQAVRTVYDDLEETDDVAVKGDVGRAMDIDEGDRVTVYWERSERSTLCEHIHDFEVLCGEDMGKDEANTPKKPLRVFVRRGKS